MDTKILLALAVLGAGCATPRELWLGGDVFLGKGGAERLAEVTAAMQPAVGVVNLEGPIGTADQVDRAQATQVGPGRTALLEEELAGPGEGARPTVQLVNGPQTAPALAEAGVVAASISNNHAQDLGAAGQLETQRALIAAGVAPLGTTVLTLGGVKVAFSAHDLSQGVPPNLAAELKAARAQGQLLIATFHVTAAPLLLPTEELKAAVELALAAGATVIAAHGTHALASVERRGEAVIAWGLGNLTFDCACTEEADGLVLKIAFDADGHLTQASAVPISAGLQGGNARLSAEPGLVLDLLQSLGTRPRRRLPDRLEF